MPIPDEDDRRCETEPHTTAAELYYNASHRISKKKRPSSIYKKIGKNPTKYWDTQHFAQLGQKFTE